MSRYIFSLMLLLASNSIFAMESEIEQSPLLSLPHEVQLNIFKKVSTPKNVEDPFEIAKTKKDVQSLRRTCKSIDVLFKDKEFKALDKNLYKYKYLRKIEKENETKKRQKDGTFDPRDRYLRRTPKELFWFAIEQNVVPYAAFICSKELKYLKTAFIDSVNSQNEK